MDREEMFRVFNMGLGIVVVASPEDAASLLKALPGSPAVGEVVRGEGDEPVIRF